MDVANIDPFTHHQTNEALGENDFFNPIQGFGERIDFLDSAWEYELPGQFCAREGLDINLLKRFGKDNVTIEPTAKKSEPLYCFYPFGNRYRLER